MSWWSSVNHRSLYYSLYQSKGVESYTQKVKSEKANEAESEESDKMYKHYQKVKAAASRDSSSGKDGSSSSSAREKPIISKPLVISTNGQPVSGPTLVSVNGTSSITSSSNASTSSNGYTSSSYTHHKRESLLGHKLSTIGEIEDDEENDEALELDLDLSDENSTCSLGDVDEILAQVDQERKISQNGSNKSATHSESSSVSSLSSGIGGTNSNSSGKTYISVYNGELRVSCAAHALKRGP